MAPTDRQTDRPTMSLIELSWTAKNVVGKYVLCLFVGHFSENGQCVSSLISEALQHRFLGDEDHVDDEQEHDEEKKY